MYRMILLGLATLAIPLASIGAPAQSPSAEELLQRMRAAYAALPTYADKGSVLVESTPIGSTPVRERYEFTTRYASPRRFHFHSRRDTGSAPERFVVWCAGETFESWWSSTGVHERYARGEGANAFAVGALPTAGAILLIAPLLFQQAGLQGPLVNLTNLQVLGTEQVQGRLAYRIRGSAPLNHWGDHSRPTTLWIDARSYLVLKIFEDTPSGAGGAVQRTTMTIEPDATPAFDAANFRFVPPRAAVNPASQ